LSSWIFPSSGSRDPISQLNQARTFHVATIGSAFEDGFERRFTDTGVSLKPYSPVAIRGVTDAAGNLTIIWKRRSRIGGGLFGRLGAEDPPLGEDSQSFEVEILDAGATTVLRTLSSTQQFATYALGAQIADFGSAPSTLNVRIYQISATVGRGYPGEATIATFPVGTPPTSEPIPSSRPYVLARHFDGAPSVGTILARHRFNEPVFYEAGLPHAQGYVVNDASSGDSVITFSRAPAATPNTFADFATMTWAAGNNDPVIAAAANLQFDEGDVIKIEFTDVGTGFSDPTFTLPGTRLS
jgi:hypothetical protein